MIEQRTDKFKTQVPSYTRTEICDANDENAIKVSIKSSSNKTPFSYFHRPFLLDKENGVRSEYNLFPIILNSDGSPWSLATLYMLDLLENGIFVDSIISTAEDIGAFNYWLNQTDEPDVFLTHFPPVGIARVTYRYHAHLMSQIYSQTLESKTASRRMLSVLGFYRWLEASKFFVPENPICEERDLTITFNDELGFQVHKKTTTTNLQIPTPEAIDAGDRTIMDEGKLRPLNASEQDWVFESAKKLGNTEVYLIMLFMVTTGARIQSACTLRRKHFKDPNPRVSKSIVDGRDEVRIKAGPGTGIDTKNNKKGLFMLPKDIYDLFHTYLHSQRAKYRCSLTESGICDDQYLFITKQGSAYFEAKEHTRIFNPKLKRRHYKKGGTVRQFLDDSLIPLIRANHDPRFDFRPHDLRASYGMNTESILVNREKAKELNPDQVRQILCALMWHKTAKVTDRYLQYRAFSQLAAIAVDEYGSQVQVWINDAKQGFGDENF